MIRISGLWVIVLFTAISFIPTNSHAIKITDNYIGSDDHGRGDVIGSESNFGIDWLDVTIIGDLMNVEIKTGYDGSDFRSADLDYGDFFVSTNGWNPYGNAPYIADNHSNGEKWEYAFDVQSGKLYDIQGAQGNIQLANLPSGYIYRNGQETEIDTNGLTAV